MEPRTALVLAIICGGLAVGITAADTVWSVHARLVDTTANPEVTVASTKPGDQQRFPEPFGGKGGCSGPSYTLVVDNRQPWSVTLDVRVWVTNAHGNETELASASGATNGAIGAYQTLELSFVVPDEARQSVQRNGFTERARLSATVGDTFLSTCVLAPGEESK